MQLQVPLTTPDFAFAASNPLLLVQAVPATGSKECAEILPAVRSALLAKLSTITCQAAQHKAAGVLRQRQHIRVGGPVKVQQCLHQVSPVASSGCCAGLGACAAGGGPDGQVKAIRVHCCGQAASSDLQQAGGCHGNL